MKFQNGFVYCKQVVPATDFIVFVTYGGMYPNLRPYHPRAILKLSRSGRTIIRQSQSRLLSERTLQSSRDFRQYHRPASNICVKVEEDILV